jgi:hypothetical protein
MLSKNIKTKIYKTRWLAFVLHGCKSWSVPLKEKHRLRLSKNGMMRKIFGLRTKGLNGTGEKYMMGSFMIRTVERILFG